MVVGPTRSPTCPFASPATPSTSERTFVNHGTLRVVLLHQVASYLRLDLSVHIAVEGGDAFGVKGNVLLNDLGNFHLRRRCRRRCLFFSASAQRQYERREQNDDALPNSPEGL